MTCDTPDKEDDDEFPLLLQVSLHAFIECLSMFQVGIMSNMGNSGFQRDIQQRNAFNPIRGTLRLVYEGDGEPFLIMLPAPYAFLISRAEENGVVTTCELTTYAPDEDEDSNEITFTPTSLVSKIIMKVNPLDNTFYDIE